MAKFYTMNEAKLQTKRVFEIAAPGLTAADIQLKRVDSEKFGRTISIAGSIRKGKNALVNSPTFKNADLSIKEVIVARAEDDLQNVRVRKLTAGVVRITIGKLVEATGEVIFNGATPVASDEDGDLVAVDSQE